MKDGTESKRDVFGNYFDIIDCQSGHDELKVAMVQKSKTRGQVIFPNFLFQIKYFS